MDDNARNNAKSATRINRRRVLAGGLGVAAWTLIDGAVALRAADAVATEDGNVARAPVSDRTQERQPFYGVHQAGVVTPRPETGMVAAFDVLASTPADIVRLFRTLTARIAFLMHGRNATGTGPKVSTAGFRHPWPGGDARQPDRHRLAGGLDVRRALRPCRSQAGALVRMMASRTMRWTRARCHGDLSLQICSNTADTNIHALRDILKTMPDLLLLRWMQDGSVPVLPAKAGKPARERSEFPWIS